MSKLCFHLEDEQATVARGRQLAGYLSAGMVVFLNGELGAGKTTFARGVLNGLGHEGAVKSPTYTLVEPYTGVSPALYHFDLYRLGDPQELEYMGVRDYFAADTLVLMEWPERGVGFLPPPDLEISMLVQGEGRELEMRAISAAGDRCLAQWEV